MKEAIERMNQYGSRHQPFVFLIDFRMRAPRILAMNESRDHLLWKTPDRSNYAECHPKPILLQWTPTPVSFNHYKTGFDHVMQQINAGNSYLLNFTQPTSIETNLSLEEIFIRSSAPYKVMLKGQFVCFSPESFVKIENNRISSYPMKGTIDAATDRAGELILSNTKELAEHHTIVDLIRNDLSLVAEDVQVERFRYLERIHTNQKDLWQVSSKITGTLPANFENRIGNIIFSLLPAGSVTGAPKRKTVAIIQKAENYERGYYTGIFGVFDGQNLDSCVLIRFIEKKSGKLIYKSGGGITFMSQAKTEYEEMLEKVYVPID